MTLESKLSDFGHNWCKLILCLWLNVEVKSSSVTVMIKLEVESFYI